MGSQAGMSGRRSWATACTAACGRRWQPAALAPAPRSTEHELHVDADAVCPRCLRWIEPGDFVRRTAYGPHQHESCA